MNAVIDQDKWLKAIAEEEAIPVGLLTASSDFCDKTFPPRPTPKLVTALELTFRIVPGATDDELAARTSLLLQRLSQREAELGGDGLELDMNGSVFGPDRLFLRLVPSRADGAAGRVAALVDEMHAAGKQANERVGGSHPESLGVKINRNFKAAIPETAMKQLEAAVVA